MESKYRKLYNHILDLLENKELNIGDQLPSESQLMKNFQLSRDTVRKALSLLEQDGYIAKAKGKLATVVDKHLLPFPFSKIRSFKELHQGIEYETLVENLELAQNPKIQKKLDLQEGEEYFRLIRIRKIEGEKSILDKDYISRRFVPNLPLKAAKESIFEYFEEVLSLPILYSKKEIKVETAKEEDYELLDLKHFDVIVVVKSYTYLEGDQLFQYTESRHRPDKFVFEDIAYRERKK